MSSSEKVPDDNYIRTANKTGMMTRYLDRIAEAGIGFAKGKTLSVLDIGCANGFVTIPLLEQGNHVIASDTASEHLEAVRNAAPADALPNLKLALGAFPTIPKLEPDILSAAIAIWVFHFFSGSELEESARKLFSALAPTGKVFISVSSPYVKFLGRFIGEFEQKLKAGIPYPGWMGDVSQYLQPHQVTNLPRSMHFLDPTVLTRVFRDAGFIIEYAEFFKRADVTEAMALDGRENTGLIARKP